MSDPSFIDLPFSVPDAVLDVSIPPSVNSFRRIDWRGQKKHAAWREEAYWMIKLSGQHKAAPKNLKGYELTITLDPDKCKADPDNIVKAANDALKHMGIITDDSPKYARRIVIEWGEAPAGCRLTIRPVPAMPNRWQSIGSVASRVVRKLEKEA